MPVILPIYVSLNQFYLPVFQGIHLSGNRIGFEATRNILNPLNSTLIFNWILFGEQEKPVRRLQWEVTYEKMLQQCNFGSNASKRQ